MLNKGQIKLLQIAVKTAGIRSPKDDRRYRMLLAQYHDFRNRPVRSCKQLSHEHLEDMLAICESMGWQCPGKDKDHFRKKVNNKVYSDQASFAQRAAIEHLAGDCGWDIEALNGFISKMTAGNAQSITMITTQQASYIIEAFKAIVSKQTGKKYQNLNELADDMEVENGKEQACPF